MKILWRLLSYLRPFGRTILLTWAISLILLALQALTVWVGAGFIERVINGGGGSAALLPGVGDVAAALNRLADRVLTRSTPFRSLAAAVAVLVGSGLLTMALRVCKTMLFARITQRVLCRVRVDLFDRLTRLDLSFSRKNRPGEIASLMSIDVEALRSAIIDVCDRSFMQPVRLVFALVLLGSLSPSLTAILLTALLGCAAVAHGVGGYVQRQSRHSMERVSQLQGFLTEYLTTVLLARSLGRETLERQRFCHQCGQLAKANAALTVTDGLAPQLLYNLFVVAGAVVLLSGGYSVLVTHTLAPGALLRFVLSLPLATYPVESLALLYVSLRRSLVSASRVFSVLDERPQVREAPDAVDAPMAFRFIDFEGVAFRPSGRSVFQGVNFRVRAGERILLCGASGAGKTTLLNMLTGIASPDSGRVLIDGRPLGAYRGESWRRRIGMVPQEALMMNATVRKNLLFAREDASSEQLVSVLLKVKFCRDTEECELTLERPVGNRGEFLSGGERQRLAIGRALLVEPMILLLDEPVAHLDAVNSRRVKETIMALPRSVTILFTSHDRSLHDLADRVIQLEGPESDSGRASNGCPCHVKRQQPDRVSNPSRALESVVVDPRASAANGRWTAFAPGR